MIGEIMRPSEFGPDAFDKFLGVARQSTVPDSFGTAVSHLTAGIAPELLDQTPTDALPPSYLDIAETVLERDFGTSELGYYALQFGITIAFFKQYDTFHSAVEPIRQQYTGKLQAYHQILQSLSVRYNYPIDEVLEHVKQDTIGTISGAIAYDQEELAKLHHLLDEANPVEDELKDTAELTAR